MNRLLLVPILLVCIGSFYIEHGIVEEAYATSKAKAVTCEDNGPCRVQISNSSGNFIVEGKANISASMTPLESALFDYEMGLFDQEMD
jgi:hypothetical protein